ncbi:MAG: TetR family transcriptional regulator [Paracoccus sp.]|nr:MAG: TetR family transcriptional regulator [Paracoccus sp. (in: a-proteobacteria)]
MTKAAGRPPLSEAEIQEFRTKVSKHAMSIYREDGFDGVSMRRLSKSVGCAPTTLYAHFAGKTEILMLLWAEVLSEMEGHVRESLKNLENRTEPTGMLAAASRAFVSYWTDHPDHFRLVFLSNNVARSDVSNFIRTGQVGSGFQMFRDLVREIEPDSMDVEVRTETLVAGLIGIVLCRNTILDYPWPTESQMIRQLLSGIIT